MHFSRENIFIDVSLLVGNVFPEKKVRKGTTVVIGQLFKNHHHLMLIFLFVHVKILKMEVEYGIKNLCWTRVFAVMIFKEESENFKCVSL